MKAPLVLAVLTTAAFYGEQDALRTLVEHRALVEQRSLVQQQRAHDQQRALVQQHRYETGQSTASVSGDGRFVAFESLARLTPADTNEVNDIYVFDVDAGRLEMMSVGLDGAAVNDSASTPRLSGDGRFVAFEAITSRQDASCVTVFVRDRQRSSTRALVGTWRDPSRTTCARRAVFSADGQWVAFDSSAPDLIEGADANGTRSDVFIVNTSTGRVERVSLASDGTQLAGDNHSASVSATGRFVAFTSTACLDGAKPPARDLMARPCIPQVFVRDRTTGVTRSIRSADGSAPNGTTHSPALSGNGRYVVFVSTATNLAPGDTNERADVYAYDLTANTIELLSRTENGIAGNGTSARPAISDSGRFVTFDSTASDLICARRCRPLDHDHNLVSDVFLLDRDTRRMRRLSQDADGVPWWESSFGPAIAATGRLIAFSSRHARDRDDVGAAFDLFVRQIPHD